MNAAHRLTLPRLWSTVLAAALLALAAPWNQGRAEARVPETPEFGPIIEGYARYDPQDECKPRPKPGVTAFRDLVLATYPTTQDFGISRACNVGGTSEHKEGRAWDWGVDASNERQKRKATNLLGWLFGTDQYGNHHAIARRVGVMYIVWNRRIWGAWGPGWETYCVMEDGTCRDPDTNAARNPHRDHMHISFSWKGARQNTTFWNPQDSYP